MSYLEQFPKELNVAKKRKTSSSCNVKYCSSTGE
jgi:hypothetical protein